jgi:hypothetical protein
MKGEHISVASCEDFIASVNDEFVVLIVETATGMIGMRGSFLQDRECRDHLARDQIFPDAEMFK